MVLPPGSKKPDNPSEQLSGDHPKLLSYAAKMTATKHDRNAWFKGGSASCQVTPAIGPRAYRMVLLGAPGVGKGTQAELISERLGPCQLSTGDVFRAAKTLDPSERTPAITAALDFMKRGELVPDETVIGILRERPNCLRCPSGFLLDGFPRTVQQAESLASMLKDFSMKLDAVLSYELPIEQIVSRLSGRRTCSGCKAVYHVTTKPPKVADVCDHCGGKLILREDDRPESIRVRMAAYEKSTAPLADYYRQRGLLVSIPAEGSPEDIYKRTVAALAARP
jgi:adenylate kinase